MDLSGTDSNTVHRSGTEGAVLYETRIDIFVGVAGKISSI